MLMTLIKIASIYKIGIFLMSLYILCFLIVSLGNFFTFIKNKLQ
jgi:hypothetical protein